MADLEKVIKGLESHRERTVCVNEKGEVCPYFSYEDCHRRLTDDALELLKEREAVEPKLVGVNTWTCGECDALLGWEDFTQSGLELVKYKFCPECGRAVKWNGKT